MHFWLHLKWCFYSLENKVMKGSPCCAGLMRSCLHTYRTKTNLTQHIIQPRGGHQPSMGGSSAKYGGVISQVWGGHQPTMGGPSTDYGGAISQVWGVINQLWGGHQPSMGGVINQLWGGVFSHQYVQEVKIHRITLATHTSCRL